jgi:hypothetical protein
LHSTECNDCTTQAWLQKGKSRFGDLTVLEFINTLNEAFCDRHAKTCRQEDGAVHPTVERECQKTFALAEEIRQAYLELGTHGPNTEDSMCVDADQDECKAWALEGKCISDAGVAA